MQRYLLDTNAIIAASAIKRNAILFTNDQALHVTTGLTVQSLKVIPLI